MKVMLVLEAVDRASRVIEAVESGIGRLAASGERIRKATDTARSDAVNRAGVGAATIGPVIRANKVFAEFEDKLTDVGLKGELSGAKLKAFGNEMIALGPKVNKSALDLLIGVDKLVEGGMKFDVAQQIIGPIAKASIATKAEMDDLSKTAVALVNNLKVIPSEIPRALDVMAQAGKEGQFELKAMAQYFPRLGAQYAAMGQEGVKATADLAAALQVIRGQVGGDQSAVAALEDVLNKMTLGPARKKFEELGIDIVNLMDDAKKAGTVFETMISTLIQATDGNAGKLQDIFGDKQALAGARALMMDYEKFLAIRQKAMTSTGVIERDFWTRMGLQAEMMNALNVAFNGFELALGKALAPLFGAVIIKLTEWLTALTALMEAHPQLTMYIVAVLWPLPAFWRSSRPSSSAHWCCSAGFPRLRAS